MQSRFHKPTLLIAALSLHTIALPAQILAPPTSNSGANFAASPLPDSPGVLSASSNSAAAGVLFPASGAFASQDPQPKKLSLPRHASPTDITIAAGQIAPSQTVENKLVGSLKDSVSPFTFVGEILSAGYAHATNGSPNYGTDSPAFGQRFGAAVARGTSQNIFYEGVMASVLHEDPRYYQLGSSHSVLRRIVYAGSRPLITRTDGGRTTPNIALLSGYLGAAALTQVYYPQPNQGFSQVMQTYGGSIGGSALGYVVTEFLPGVFQAIHLKKVD